MNLNWIILATLLTFLTDLINLTCSNSQCTMVEELSPGHSRVSCLDLQVGYSNRTGASRSCARLQFSGENACCNKPFCCLLGAHDPNFSSLFSLLFLKRINSPSSPFHLANLGKIEFLPLHFCIP